MHAWRSIISATFWTSYIWKQAACIFFHVWLPLLNIMFERVAHVGIFFWCCILDSNPLLDISFANLHLRVFIVNSYSLEPYWIMHWGLCSKWKSLSHVWLFVAHGILQGSRILEWVAFPFSKGSSQPRGQTRVSHTAGGFCTSWALQRGLFYQMSGGTSTWVGQI